MLEQEFKSYSVYIDGGTEFYKKTVIPLILDVLTKYNIEAIQLTSEEIGRLTGKHYSSKSQKSESSVVNCYYTKRDYQLTIIDTSVVHFQEHSKGILVLMCGIGKTLISLWITQELKLNTILIGVPNIQLLDQWKNVITLLYPTIPQLSVYENCTINK
jgi:superfamily II DNA or RNA helicase